MPDITSSKSTIILLVGLPGSGKSTWAAGKPGVLSSDEIRRLLADDPDNQNIHARVFQVLRDLLKHRLELKRPITHVDATNLTPYERRPYFEIAAQFNCRMEAIFFDVPSAECIRRNSRRNRVVPAEVICDMAKRLVAPSYEEGFSQITVVK